MEAVLSRATWLTLLGHANDVIDPKSPMASLREVQITTDGRRLTARATDLVRAYEGSRPVSAGKAGGLCVNANLFEKVIKAMPEGEILVRVEGATATVVNLAAKRKGSKIGVTGAEDHPSHPEPKGAPVALPLERLHELFDLTCHAQGNDDARPHLAATLLDWQGPVLRAVATDGHRLSTVTVAAPPYDAKVIVPRVAVDILRKLPRTGEVTLTLATERVGWAVGDDRWLTKTVDSAYPSWEQVVPSSHEGVLTVNRLALLASIRAVSTVVTDRTNAVRLSPRPDGLYIDSNNPELGEMSDTVPCEASGRVPEAWGINAAYLADALNACPGEKVELWLTGELDPVEVHDPSLGDRNHGVIMPMRV